MIRLHHLNQSRSHRVLWLLEELDLPYEIAFYERDPVTRLAPASLKAIHPLGKSPVITDGDVTVAESGAIIDYLIDSYGQGRLRPERGTGEYVDYLQWLHFAEGSAMLPLMLGLYVGRLGEAGGPLWPRIFDEMQNHLGYMNEALAQKPFIAGDSLTGADIQLSFVAQSARSANLLTDYPHIVAYVDRLVARPAYIRALEKGGPVEFTR
ncbi:MAG: glutathione S-transferase family protein [Parvibaculaceae bacterium]|nr:glutathione S-transferase family protein [Parvibaculaceae bacterium]